MIDSHSIVRLLGRLWRAVIRLLGPPPRRDALPHLPRDGEQPRVADTPPQPARGRMTVDVSDCRMYRDLVTKPGDRRMLSCRLPADVVVQRDAEVEKPDHATVGHQEVARLHVPVHDVELVN